MSNIIKSIDKALNETCANPKIIIQARIGSTRLPKKMILPFYESQGIFSILLQRISKRINKSDIILATSVNAENDILDNIAKENEVACFRGSENDVLQRFIDAAEHYNSNMIIRVCADNPFLDINCLEKLYHEFANFQCDYLAFKTSEGIPTIKTHYGFWAEAVRIDALKRIKFLTDENLYHEHVTNYIYSHPNEFKIVLNSIPQEIEKNHNLRLTIDTEKDFEIQKEIFDHIYRDNKDFSCQDVCKYLINNQKYFTIMKEEILKNQK